jgi:hypothetical protein
MRKRGFKSIFINGKQKRIKREPKIDGMDEEEFLRRNADAVWLVQNEMYELTDPDDLKDVVEKRATDNNGSDQIPF